MDTLDLGLDNALTPSGQQLRKADLWPRRVNSGARAGAGQGRFLIPESGFGLRLTFSHGHWRPSVASSSLPPHVAAAHRLRSLENLDASDWGSWSTRRTRPGRL